MWVQKLTGFRNPCLCIEKGEDNLVIVARFEGEEHSKYFEDITHEMCEELKQYRSIGTIEEMKAAVKYYSLAKKHGTVGEVIDACTEYEAIGTVEEFRKLKEKATAKLKPIERGDSTGCVYNNVERDWDFMK